MQLYAMIRGGAIERREYADAQPADLAHKGITWLPIVEQVPQHDPATEMLSPVVETIEAARVVWFATKRAKTAEEFDADKDGAISAVDAVVLKVLLNHENRVRAIEAKAPITAAQFRAALRALL